MPQGVGQTATSLPVIPYVTNASTSPMLIPVSIHGQGPNVVVGCWSGLLTVDFHLTGAAVLCEHHNDGSGNITVYWADNTVGSVMISAAGTGPPGPSGLGATPYVTNSTSSPMLITQTTHGQGFNVITTCYAGALAGGHITGTQFPCTVLMDPAGSGNVTVSWSGSAVGSVMVQASGRPAPFVINATSSPMVIPVATHSQGFSQKATCFDGPVIGGVTTGFQVYCATSKNSSGDVTVIWGGSTVASVQIQ